MQHRLISSRSIVEMVVILLIIIAQPFSLAQTDSGPSRTGGNTNSRQPPVYAVIDLFAFPYQTTHISGVLKVKNSGYVLVNEQYLQYNVGGYIQEVWYNGQTYPLSPHTAGDGFEVTDISEDGVVIGDETTSYNYVFHDEPGNEIQFAVWSHPTNNSTPILTEAPPEEYLGEAEPINVGIAIVGNNDSVIYRSMDQYDLPPDGWKNDQELGTLNDNTAGLDLEGNEVQPIQTNNQGDVSTYSAAVNTSVPVDQGNGIGNGQPLFGPSTYYINNTQIPITPTCIGSEINGSPFACGYLYIGDPDYYWDGRDQSYHSLGWGSGNPVINGATSTTNGVTVPAVQVVDGNFIANMNPATQTFGPPQSLDYAVTASSGWSKILGTSINDNGAIVGTATYSPTGPTDPIAAGSHGVMLLPLSFVRETSPGSGDFEPIKDNGLDDQAQLPIFASETGQGMTETDTGGYTLNAVLSTDLSATSTASFNVTYSKSGGGSYTGTLTETGAGTGIFKDSGSTNVLTLTPSNQTTSSATTLSTLSGTITIPSLSVSSQPVTLIETVPLNYQASTVLTDVALAGTLSTTVVNSITVTFHSNFSENDAITLTETGVNTRVFQNTANGVTLTMTGFTGGTSMNISVSATGLTPSSFGSTLTETSATSLQYSDYQRSYGTATNYTPATDGQGVFYVQFPGSTATSITLVSGGNSVTTMASPVTGQPNMLRTGKLVLLEPSDSFSASGFTTLTVSPPSGGGTPTVQLQMYGQTIVDPGTVHDAYLGFGLGEGDGSVHLGQIKNILAANASSPSTPNLGWTVPTVHGVSVKSDVLNEIGKHSLWYVFTHGLTADGHTPPLVSFRLYNSSDPNDHKQAQLVPGDVSANIGTDTYELVFFNGCFSADPSSGSAAPAFAANFKADVYVGWTTAEFDIFAYNAGKTFFTTLEQHNSIQNALNAVNNTRAFKTTAQLRVIGDPTVVSKTIIDKSPIPPQ
jgi:hypothetical protein